MAAHFFLPFPQVTIVFFSFPSMPVYTCCCCSLIPHSHINALASFLTGLALSNVIFHLPITNIFISPHPFCPLSSICHFPTLLPLETLYLEEMQRCQLCGYWSQSAWIRILTLPLQSAVAFSKLMNLSLPLFPHL